MLFHRTNVLIPQSPRGIKALFYRNTTQRVQIRIAFTRIQVTKSDIFTGIKYIFLLQFFRFAFQFRMTEQHSFFFLFLLFFLISFRYNFTNFLLMLYHFVHKRNFFNYNYNEYYEKKKSHSSDSDQNLNFEGCL